MGPQAKEDSVTRNRQSQNGSKVLKHVTTETEKEIDILSEEYPPLQIVWKNVIGFIFLHTSAFYGLYLWATNQVMWQTFALAVLLILFGGYGITVGAHRLWTHRAFKAKLPLRLFLLVAQTAAFQNSVLEWSRDHRVHHKFTETHADPHNIKRGFFFAHMGWLMAKKDEAVKIKGKLVDMSDLEADPFLRFQDKYYVPIVLSVALFLPAIASWYFWGEDPIVAWCANNCRYAMSLHGTWLVNSAAHMYGNKPYDRNIHASENKLVSILTFGEGWHNYHHVFPWDYKTSELGFYKYNFSTAFIDLMAYLGQAYDLKSIPEHVVKQRVLRTGDGTHIHSNGTKGGDQITPGPYGWGDPDIPEEDVAITQIFHKIL